MDTMAAAIRSTDDPLAAALAAAAALARNGGAFFFNAPAAVQQPSLNFPATAAASAAAVSNGASTLMAPPPTVLPPSIAALLSAATDISTVAPKQYTKHDSDHEEEDEDDDEDEENDGQNTEEDAERRIARSRERNREHARRTRLRKKAQLQTLQSKVNGLQAESKFLKQSLEECSIASILVGLSSGERDATIQSLLREANAIESKEIFQVVARKRKRFLSDADSSCERLTPAQQVLEIKAKNGTIIRVGGGRSQINWKSGLYVDEDGIQRQLSHEQLECLRRERNRMHAKMTRDRKKNFIANIQQTIDELEKSNRNMKAVLAEVVQTHFKPTASASSISAAPVGVTPTVSPAIGPKSSATVKVPPLAPSMLTAQIRPVPRVTTPSQSAGAPLTEQINSISPPPASKRVCHGFSLKI